MSDKSKKKVNMKNINRQIAYRLQRIQGLQDKVEKALCKDKLGKIAAWLLRRRVDAQRDSIVYLQGILDPLYEEAQKKDRQVLRLEAEIEARYSKACRNVLEYAQSAESIQKKIDVLKEQLAGHSHDEIYSDRDLKAKLRDGRDLRDSYDTAISDLELAKQTKHFKLADKQKVAIAKQKVRQYKNALQSARNLNQEILSSFDALEYAFDGLEGMADVVTSLRGNAGTMSNYVSSVRSLLPGSAREPLPDVDELPTQDGAIDSYQSPLQLSESYTVPLSAEEIEAMF